MKTYNQAPLPFQGQKRKFLKAFKAALKQYPDNAIYVDLFGGSGLLSHTVKRTYPDARVIYNDFDNYSNRLENIPKTNLLLAEIRELVKGTPKDKPLTPNLKKSILDLISKEKGFVDYVTLSSSLLFSMNYATCFEDFSKQGFYNVVKQSDYSADGYLEGLEVVSMDYQTLYCEYATCENVVYLIDPPYLSTDVGTYTKNFWRLGNYLDVLDVMKGSSYFYFTSNKSQVVELCEWVATKTSGTNPFQGSTYIGVNTSVNYSSKYTDMMFHKSAINC